MIFVRAPRALHRPGAPDSYPAHGQ
jgi:hypothetical protein